MTPLSALLLFLVILTSTSNIISSLKNTNSHATLNLSIQFIPHSSSLILQHLQTDIRHILQNLSQHITIHRSLPSHHSYNLSIPKHCQSMLFKDIQSISIKPSETIVYITSNASDTDCHSHSNTNPFHSQHCLFAPNKNNIKNENNRLLFGIINLCNANLRTLNLTLHLQYSLHKLLHTSHNSHRHLLSHSYTLSAQNKSEILFEINARRSLGALGQIQLGQILIPQIMQSTRMEAYLWDDALMQSAMLKAQTCDIHTPSLNTTLSQSYIANALRIPIVDSTQTLVGEIVYTATQSLSFNDAIDEALDHWIEDCKFLDYFNVECLNTAPSVQNCDNCRRLLDETARFIGCGFAHCNSQSIAVVCHIYYSTNVHNLAFPQMGYVPYWSPGGSGVQCSQCPNDRRSECVVSEGLCRGCPSLNYEACVYANGEMGQYCPPMMPDLGNCTETGVTTAMPTLSPTLAPTFTPTNTIGELDIADLLENVINFKRRRVATGEVIHFPNSAVGVRATNMEKLIWDQSLAITAQNISMHCENVYTNVSVLGKLYQETLSNMGTNARVIVSDDSNNILVGETMHVVTDWMDANDAALQAFDAWENECERFHWALDCDGSETDAILCRNCLQLIWSKTRYIGCALSGCDVIGDGSNGNVYNGVLFVCHWYWAADLFGFSGDTNWLLPYNPSGSDDFCQEMPFFIAGCNDTERNSCDDALCDGCQHDNFHQCSTDIITFNQQQFGNEGCAFEPIQPTCSDGVTPTFSPTAAPSFTLPDLHNVLGIANAFRSQKAGGNIPATNMQSWIWHEPLAQSAFCTAHTCDITPTDQIQLSSRFQQTTTLTVSADINNILIGETRFISTNWINPETSLIEAITHWFNTCEQMNYTFGIGCCKGQCSIHNCAQCLQMIWADTRYMGCSYDSCASITDEDGSVYNDALYVVCHFYFGANISESTGLVPYKVGLPCTNCPLDRRNCTLDQCSGCPADNWELCTISEPNTCNVTWPVLQNCTESGIPSPQLPEYTQCPTLSPSDSPTFDPTFALSAPPSTAPTFSPTYVPTDNPTDLPTPFPTNLPSPTPTNTPSEFPTYVPTENPTLSPTHMPTDIPTATPTNDPTITPSNPPSITPSVSPSVFPSDEPSTVPTDNPSANPSNIPSDNPTVIPTDDPSNVPSGFPTHTPSINPTDTPSNTPLITPSISPLNNPTISPIPSPTNTHPTVIPTTNPTNNPAKHTYYPTNPPSITPSVSPSIHLTNNPTHSPFRSPTDSPIQSHTANPTNPPSTTPSISPSISATDKPTNNPIETHTTNYPTLSPTNMPTDIPTNDPTITPPTINPTKRTYDPTSIYPSITPTNSPSHSIAPEPPMTPSISPSTNPTLIPTDMPTYSPTNTPTNYPTDAPYPSRPMRTPTDTPTPAPTTAPNTSPTTAPHLRPTWPTKKPTNKPTQRVSGTSPHDMLVAVDVCFTAEDTHNSHYPPYGTFILPYSGQIYGMTLAYHSGGIYENTQAIRTNWGINEMINLFCIHITDDDLRILYPNTHTNGYDPHCNNISTIPQYFPFSHFIKDDTMYCLHDQSVTNYKLHFIDTEVKEYKSVRAGDVMRIYWNNVLFDSKHFTDELNGQLCVDVMVYYYHMSDERRRKKKRKNGQCECRYFYENIFVESNMCDTYKSRRKCESPSANMNCKWYCFYPRSQPTPPPSSRYSYFSYD